MTYFRALRKRYQTRNETTQGVPTNPQSGDVYIETVTNIEKIYAAGQWWQALLTSSSTSTTSTSTSTTSTSSSTTSSTSTSSSTTTSTSTTTTL